MVFGLSAVDFLATSDCLHSGALSISPIQLDRTTLTNDLDAFTVKPTSFLPNDPVALLPLERAR
ncbi:MAG TPA: hypothetical protein DCS31_04640 [Candidatus Competibacteraceae bacterium]|nr:hypothetical protein [Candidatus Competibacteraceae bacterium]